jgi:hypothetical protein
MQFNLSLCSINAKYQYNILLFYKILGDSTYYSTSTICEKGARRNKDAEAKAGG